MTKNSVPLSAKHPKCVRTTHGLFVVIIGPDGSGKSTLVERAIDELACGFRATWRFHWRPGLLPKPVASPANNPLKPAAPPRNYAYGRVISFFRYLYYLTDFIVGYWTVIFPKKVRATLVFGERWYYDVIVNPQRYGFRLPSWLLRLGGRLVPKPDLTVLLEAAPEEIHARKPELSVEELRLQLQKMRSVLPDSGRCISTAGSIDRSADELVRAVLDATQRHAAFARNVNTGQQDGWRAFPRTGNVKLWIHARDPIANALHLYHPYSWFGRLVIRIMAYLPRRLTTRFLQPMDDMLLEKFAGTIRRMLGHDDVIVSFYTGTPDYTGTPNAHRKITAQVSRDGAVIAYVKIGSSEKAKRLIEAEAHALSRLDRAALAAVVSVPRVLAQATMDDSLLLAISAPGSPGRQRPTALDERDIRFLISLVPTQPQVEPLINVLEAIGLGTSAARREYPGFMAHAGEAVTTLFEHGVRLGPSHGDYVPWNTLTLSDGSLYVFDWEYATEAPLLTDLLHRVFMPDRLVNGGIPASVAISRLLALADAPLVRPVLDKCGIGPAEFPAYLLLYFLRLAERETHEKGGIDEYLRECIHLTLVFLKHPAPRLTDTHRVGG